jgi:threonine aldolase
MICDLRSDVLGPLSAEVMEAFQRAAVQPPGFGRHDDREEQTLCLEAAELFGFEDALFLPTGTLANQIAVRLWVQPGQAIVADSGSHLATNEAASVAGLNGAVVRRVNGEQGHPSPDQIEESLTLRNGSAAEREPHLIWLENTHNRSGGTVMPAGQLGAIADLARRRQLAVHVDGARIWNALAATDEEPQRILQGASSAMVALNKIAGAPVGALLLGRSGFIAEATSVQKMFGGLWRPVGPLAAAASVALQQWPSRARKSHECAALFASRLGEQCDAACHVDLPQTNIVMLQLESESHVDRVLASLADTPVRISAYRLARLRCVFHPGILPDDVNTAADIVARAINSTVVPLRKPPFRTYPV